MEPITKAQFKEYNRMTRCHICFGPFKPGNRKVRYHCYYSGIYRGAAHTLCNLQYKIPTYIQVVFHNLAEYDGHMFIKELAKYGAKMRVIAKSIKDYISFAISVEVGRYIDKNGQDKPKEIDVRFIESIKSMSSSLDSLVNNLACRGNRLFGFDYYNESQYGLLIRKGIYLYEYMDNWDCFEEISLPPKSSFYSKRNMSGVSDQDYEHACKVWRDFGIRNFRDYHNLYLKTDVILLANIFEAFRKVCLYNYELDPTHFYTTSGLAWCTCLKKTGIRHLRMGWFLREFIEP